jgi:hypothetical protein
MSSGQPVARLSVRRALREGVRLAWEHRLDVFRLAGPLLLLVIFVEQLGLAATVASDSDKAVFWDHLIDVLSWVLVMFVYIIADHHLYRLALGAKVESAIDIDWQILLRLVVAYLKFIGLFFLASLGIAIFGIAASRLYLQGFGREVYEHAAEALAFILIWIWLSILMIRLTFYLPDLAMGRVVKLRTAWRETWNLPVSFCIGLFVFYTLSIGVPIFVSEPFTDTGYQSRLWLLGRNIFYFLVYVLIIFMVSVLYRQWYSDPHEETEKITAS